MNAFLPRARPWLLLGAVVALAFCLRCWTARDVFAGGGVFFLDPDCYSRMTRVERVVEHPGTVVHRHEFENWPAGTRPHTTAPFDYVIAAAALVLRPCTARALDLAGAWVPVGLGVAALAFLWGWAGRLGLGWGVPMGVLFAASPMLVHATALGRPDHQALVVLLVAVALGAEAALCRAPSRGWGLAAGAAWGLALWVSLYEPAVLLGLALALGAVLNPRGLFGRERLPGWGLFGLLILLALAIEGVPSLLPEPEVLRLFPSWSRTIGELARVPFFSGTWLAWSLAWLPAAPLLLFGAARRGERLGAFWLGLLLALFLLTAWQARWGYFFALGFVMSLPVQMAELRRWLPWKGRALALALFVLALWPVAAEWDRWFSPAEMARRQEQREDNLALREVALQLRGERRLPVLAPWWFSPALAYWSGQPCVAGSSHQSLPGTADTARFYLATDWGEAGAILARRRVACVVAYDPGRVTASSAALLGLPMPPEEEARKTAGALLFTRPHSPPPGLEPVYGNRAFRVFLRPEGVE